MATSEIVPAPVLFPGSMEELRRIVEAAAADPDRSPVVFGATSEELLRIAGGWAA